MAKKLLLLLLLLNFAGVAQATNYTADANCVGAWTMDVDESPIDDVSPNSNTMALKDVGEPDYATASPPDTYSVGYYDWDGLNDYTASSLVSNATTNISMTIWAYWNDASGQQSIFENGYRDGPGTNDGYGITINDGNGGASNKICITLWGVDWDVLDSNVTTLSQTTWTHLVATRGASTWTLYKNGNAVQTGSGNPNTPTAATELGASKDVSVGFKWFFNGNLDEAAFFTRELSSTEVGEIYDFGLAGAAATGYGQVI